MNTVLLVGVGLFILIYGVHVYWVGFHNVDICHNEKAIENQLNDYFEEKDIGVFGTLSEIVISEGEMQIWGLENCYISGMHQLQVGFYTAITGAVLIGLFIPRK